MGKPYGHFAWGGQYEVLPVGYRVASVSSIMLYIFFMTVILNQAGVIALFDPAGWPQTAMVAITVYSFIGIGMNAISRSKPERYTMTPIVTVLALLFLYVTKNPLS